MAATRKKQRLLEGGTSLPSPWSGWSSSEKSFIIHAQILDPTIVSANCIVYEVPPLQFKDEHGTSGSAVREKFPRELATITCRNLILDRTTVAVGSSLYYIGGAEEPSRDVECLALDGGCKSLVAKTELLVARAAPFALALNGTLFVMSCLYKSCIEPWGECLDLNAPGASWEKFDKPPDLEYRGYFFCVPFEELGLFLFADYPKESSVFLFHLKTKEWELYTGLPKLTHGEFLNGPSFAVSGSTMYYLSGYMELKSFNLTTKEQKVCWIEGLPTMTLDLISGRRLLHISADLFCIVWECDYDNTLHLSMFRLSSSKEGEPYLVLDRAYDLGKDYLFCNYHFVSLGGRKEQEEAQANEEEDQYEEVVATAT